MFAGDSSQIYTIQKVRENSLCKTQVEVCGTTQQVLIHTYKKWLNPANLFIFKNNEGYLQTGKILFETKCNAIVKLS